MTITIELTKGQVTVIDDIDADLAGLKWTALADRHGDYYAYRKSARPHRRTVLLHRVILERMTGRPLTKAEHADHINGDKLDNRRENLRIATDVQNKYNRGMQRNNKSGFKGVTWHLARKRWRATIGVNGKPIHLGVFNTAEEAYQAYCKAAKELHGEFANTGTPVDVENE